MANKIFTLENAKLFEGSDESPHGSFEGYGSVYGNYDRVGEAVEAGAFKNLDAFVQDGFIAVGHDWSALPIATIASAKSDDKGLLIKADFHSTVEAQHARTVMQERQSRGKSIGLSIGYTVNDSDETEGGILLKDLTLYEVSLVNVGANDKALVTSAKGMPLAGESLSDQSERVLATVRDYNHRVKGLYDLKSADNRPFSSTRRAELIALEKALAGELKGLQDLIAATAPKADPSEARAIAARILMGA